MHSTSFDFERLRSIGLAQPVIDQFAPWLAADGGRLMRITEVQRDRVTLHDGEQEWPARALPALVQALLIDDDVLAVGDWVLADHNRFGEWWIGTRVAPITQLARRDTYGHRQVLVSNVDTVLIVMGLDHDFNLPRLDRYVSLSRLAGVGAVLVLTKADGCADTATRLVQAQARLAAGMHAVAVNGLDPGTRDVLAPWLEPGRTLVLLGSSGAGKSTLTNTLAGRTVQLTGAAREDDSRGRHTTTARSLIRCDGGACIIDTPGLRTLRLDADEQGLAAAFDDITRFARGCRFRDCQHDGEPGCAVREAVSPDRLKNYHKLQREARRDTLNALERRQQVALWKQRGRDAQLRLKAKRG